MNLTKVVPFLVEDEFAVAMVEAEAAWVRALLEERNGVPADQATIVTAGGNFHGRTTSDPCPPTRLSTTRCKLS